MTHEELAKIALDSAVAELRFYYEAAGQESERYDMLRLSLFRHFLETHQDREFVRYASKRNRLFIDAAASQQHEQRSIKMMESPEFLSAMKNVESKMHDDHPHST